MQTDLNAESIHEGVNWRSKDVTQGQQERLESPTVTLTCHVGTRYITAPEVRLNTRYINFTRGTSSGGVYVPCIYTHAR